MAVNHMNKLWMSAPANLIEAVARRLCARQLFEVLGREVTSQDVVERWGSFELEARDAIALVREYYQLPK